MQSTDLYWPESHTAFMLHMRTAKSTLCRHILLYRDANLGHKFYVNCIIKSTVVPDPIISLKLKVNTLH